MMLKQLKRSISRYSSSSSTVLLAIPLVHVMMSRHVERLTETY